MKLKVLFILVIAIGILEKGIAQSQNEVHRLAGYDVQLIGDLGKFTFDWKVKTIEEGLEIATINISSDQPAMPSEFSLKWNLPSSNIAGHWSTGSYLNKNIKPDWWPSSVKAMLAREAPVISLFGHDDVNQLNFSVSDALNTSILNTAVREEDGMIYNEIILFSEKHKKLTEYEIQIRFDTRSIHYASGLNQVADWWASFDEYKPLAVPEDARKPMYSSWYSYHQSVSRKELVEECKLAKVMGFESIIVDDGK